MKNLYIILIALFIVNSASAQSCLPEGITFSTQNQIDSFQVNYPGCKEIEGNVIISDNYSGNITNLNSLTALTNILGDLQILVNKNLVNLEGLNNLTSIGGMLSIVTNDALNSLTGLESLTSIGGDLELSPSITLKNLTGLDNLASVGGKLYIGYTYLEDFIGLDGLTMIGGDLQILENDALITLAGLENLSSVGGVLDIWGNDYLPNLNGIQNIIPSSITGLYIRYNSTLSACEVKSVCDYLAAPNAAFEIHDNASGCNSQDEVHLVCTFGMDENCTSECRIKIYPTPGSTTITLSMPTSPEKNTILTIDNINGQQLIQRQIMQHQTVVDVSGLSQGVYIVRIINDKTVKVRKIIIDR